MNFWDILLADKLDGKDIPPHSYQLQEFESAGQTAAFTASALPMPTLSTDIVSSQDLHGYDKPWAGGEGKNKLPLVLSDIKALNTSGTWNGNVYTKDGIDFTVITDNANNVLGINANGTATDLVGITLASSKPISAGSYVLNGTASGSGWSTSWLNVNVESSDYNDIGSGVSFTASTDTTMMAYCYIASGAVISDKTFYPMIRLSAETDPTFEPYSNICPIVGTDTIDIDVTGGESYTIDLDGTRYGGQLDVGSGVLTVDKQLIDLKSLTYAGTSGGGLAWSTISNLPTLTQNDVISDKLGDALDDDVAWFSTVPCYVFREDNTQLRVYGSAEIYTTGAYADTHICIPMQPTTVQLTPTQVWAVQGGNTITTTGQGLRGSYFKAI